MVAYILITCPHCTHEYLAASFIIHSPTHIECPNCHQQFERELAPTRELGIPGNKSNWH